MPPETYLTQFICICEYCDAQTIATTADRTITVSCGKCVNRYSFQRPQSQLNTASMTSALRGRFKVYDQYIS